MINFVLMSTVALLLDKAGARTITANCESNDECISSYGPGSCCFYEDKITEISITCKDKDDLDYIMDPKRYDPEKQTYYDSTLKIPVYAFCKGSKKGKEEV